MATKKLTKSGFHCTFNICDDLSTKLFITTELGGVQIATNARRDLEIRSRGLNDEKLRKITTFLFGFHHIKAR